MKKIVVVGGGFAGISAIRGLRNTEGIHITLISDQDEFRYSPALYRTATGRLKRESIIPLEDLVGDIPNSNFIQAKLARIDRSKRLLYTDDGQEIPYDYCILALGVVTSYFGIKGLDVFSYSIKSAAEIERLKRHLHEQLTQDHRPDKEYVIVGAGPTGVELASALGQYINRIAKFHQVRKGAVTIELIEAVDRILPTMPDKAGRIAAKELEKLGVVVHTNSKVMGETENTLRVDERSIATHTVIWTAGVSNNPFFQANASEFNLDKRQRVVVDDYMSVDNHVFVIGDNAASKYSGLALTAVHQGKYVSYGIKQLLNDQAFDPYHQLPPIYAVPLGAHRAIIHWQNFVFGGILPGLLRSVADLIGYSDVMGVRGALKLWLRRDEYEESCPICNAPQVTP